MAAIKIVPFRGMRPRVADRLLPAGAAVDATNVNLTSGEIRPIKQPLLVHFPEGSGPWLAAYRAEHMGAEKWLTWNSDVDVVRAPLPPSVEPRFYWVGDREPRYAPFSKLPADILALGIPRPKAAPGVSHSGGTGAATSRVYVYTFYSALNEESGESPASALTTGKVDGTWAISGMDAFPANSGTGTASHAAGVTTFTNTGNHWLRAGDEILIAATKVVVATTPTSGSFTVPGNFAGATSWSRVAPWNTVGMKRRLYRSAGTTGSYQLVHDDVGTTYNDTKTDAQILGDELISQSWDPPPINLRGLISLPNGALAGFFDNQLCYSEPYQPHAWPTEYRRATDYEIVGIEAFGSTVVACTAGMPYLANGSEPAVVTLERVNQVWPCLAKRSVISLGNAVMYATSYGMAMIGMGEPFIWTEPYFSRTEWALRNPASMIAAVSAGRIYIAFNAGEGFRGTLVFNPTDENEGLTEISGTPDELYADPRNGQLYLVSGDGVKLFDAAPGTRNTFSWRSAELELPYPMNLAAAKVEFVSEMTQADFDAQTQEYNALLAGNAAAVGTYTGSGGLAGSPLNTVAVSGSIVSNIGLPDVSGVTFTLYRKGEAVFSRQLVSDVSAFRLPAGFRSDYMSIGLTGTVRIQSVKLADSMSGLKAV